MSNDIIIDLGGPATRPNENDVPRTGERRFVKLIPMPGNYAAPAIWSGPIKPQEIDGKYVRARECVVLVSKDPIQTMKITIPVEFYDVLPDIPVEW